MSSHVNSCFLLIIIEMEEWSVLRGCWFEVISDKWYPVPETEHQHIEGAHMDRQWREKVIHLIGRLIFLSSYV